MGRGKHKRDRANKAIKGFDTHKGANDGRMAAKHRDGGHGRMPIGCFASRRYAIDPLAPHFRMTARTPALSGDHLRAVARPPKAAHCKTDSQ